MLVSPFANHPFSKTAYQRWSFTYIHFIHRLYLIVKQFKIFKVSSSSNGLNVIPLFESINEDAPAYFEQNTERPKTKASFTTAPKVSDKLGSTNPEEEAYQAYNSSN